MSIDFIIREGELRDKEIIATNNMNMAEETENKQLNYEMTLRGVEEALKDKEKGEYFLAEHEGKIIGQLMITKEWSDWRNCFFVWVQSVYTIPEFRGKGVFSALYEYVKKLAKDRKYCGVRLYVDKDNKKAIEVYFKLGMKQSNYLLFEEEF